MKEIKIDLGNYYAVTGEEALATLKVDEGATGSLLTESGERLLLASENGKLRRLKTELVDQVVQPAVEAIVEKQKVEIEGEDGKPAFEEREIVIQEAQEEIIEKVEVPAEKLIPATSPSGYLVPKYIDPTCHQRGIPLDAQGKSSGFTSTDTTNLDRFGESAEGYIHQPQKNDGWPDGWPKYIQS